MKPLAPLPFGPSPSRGALAPRQPRQVGQVREDPARAFAWCAADRRRHTQIIGGSGSGKSKLLELLVRQDLEDPGAGLCLIDPHGEVYDDLVHYLSHRRPELARRVILFDPADQEEMVLGFNALGPLAWENPYFALNAVLTGILKTWGQGNLNETPRIGRWLENILAVLISNRLTLLEALPLISAARDSSDRQQLTRALNTELVRQDWEEYDQATSQQRHAYIEGPHNRMRKLLRSACVRNMFGVQEKLLDVRRVMAERKLLLVKLAPNNRIDDADMQMVGILLIHELFRAALRRDPRAAPPPFYLYIDEFARYVTDDIAYMLDQCRKFGLFLTLIHQQLEQLKTENDYLYASVMTNCRNRVVFGSLSYRDAELLSQEIDTGFEDLLEVKYRTEQTKFRPIEELRATWSCGEGESEGFTAAWQQGISLGHSVGRALARGRSSSETVSSGSSTGESLARARTLARTLGHSQGASRSRSDVRSEAEALSASLSRGEGSSHSRGRHEGSQHSEGETAGWGATDGASRSALDLPGAPVTLGRQHSEQETGSRSSQDGTSAGTSVSDSENVSQAVQAGISRTRARAAADAHGEQAGSQESATTGSGETATATRTEQQGKAHSHSESETVTQQETDSLARQFSLSGSRQAGRSSQQAVSVSPFHRLEEFREETLHYWSLPEQRHRLVAELKNQGVAEATFRLGSGPPVRVKIGRVDSPPWLPSSSPQLVADFRQAVYRAAPEYYQTPAEAEAEIRGRQTRRFGRAFDYEWFPAPPGAGPLIEGTARQLPGPEAGEPGAAAAGGSHGPRWTR